MANYTSSQGVEAALAPFVLAAEVSADTSATKTFELKGKTINPDSGESLAVFNVAIQALKINSSGVT